MRIGLVGCGTIAATHLRILNDLMPEAEIYLCDQDTERARHLAANQKARPIFTTLQEMLDTQKPEALHILTPPPSHFELAQQSLEAGCHTFIEKPVTETARDFEALRTLAESGDRILCAGYSTLGMPVLRRLKQDMTVNRFGHLIAVHCHYGCSWPGGKIPYGDPTHWAYRLKGGIFKNMIDHPLSLIVDALDTVRAYKLSVIQRNILPNHCADLLHLVLEGEDQLGSLTLSLGHGSADRRAHLLFENGSVVVDMSRMLYSAFSGRGPHNFIKKALSGIAEGVAMAGGTGLNIWQGVTGKLKKEPGITCVVRNFYNRIGGTEEAVVSNDTVLTLTRLLDQIWTEVREQTQAPRNNGKRQLANQDSVGVK